MSLRIGMTGLDRLATNLDRGASSAASILAAHLAAAAPAMATLGREAIAAVTPVSHPDEANRNPYFPDPPAPGGLQRSTAAISTVDGTSIKTVVLQPATSPNDSSRWGGRLIAAFVEYGHGDIDPVNKKALAGAYFGPARHVGPLAGRNYPADAATTITEGVAAEAGTIASGVAEGIREALAV